MSQIKAEISLRTNVKLNFHKNVGLKWYQWIPDFYNIRFEQTNLTEKIIDTHQLFSEYLHIIRHISKYHHWSISKIRLFLIYENFQTVIIILLIRTIAAAQSSLSLSLSLCLSVSVCPFLYLSFSLFFSLCLSIVTVVVKA